MNKIKEIYLLFLIVIGLASLSVYSTYALFTASVEVDQVVELEATISTDNDIMEYESITLASGDVKTIGIEINNTHTDDLYYGLWYEVISGSSSEVLIGTIYSVNATGRLSSGGDTEFNVGIQNYGDNPVTIYVGVKSSLTTDLGLENSRLIIPSGWNPRKYKITYYLGNAAGTGGATKLGETECYYNTSCRLSTFASLNGVFPYSAEDNSKNGRTNYFWQFHGWGKNSTTTLSKTYDDGQLFTYKDNGDISLYALGIRTLNFYGYKSSGTTSLGTDTQVWNPYSNASGYLQSVTVPSSPAVSTWTFRGYTDNLTSVSESDVDVATSYAGKSTYVPPYNVLPTMSSLYKRTLTLAYNSNGGSGTISDVTNTQYYNSGVSGSGTYNNDSLSFKLASSGFTKTDNNLVGWTLNSTTGTQYNLGATYTGLKPTVSTTTVKHTMYAKWEYIGRPTCQITASTTGWTKNNVTLTVVGSDSSGVLASSPYSWDNNTSYGTATTKSVSSNGTYTAYVKNGAGGESSCSYKVDNIDKTDPTCSISGNPTNWTNSPISLTVTYDDNSNAFASTPVKWNDNSTNIVKSVAANGTYSVTVTDKAGNTCTKSVEVTKYDVGVPTCSITASTTSVTNSAVTLTASNVSANGGELATSPYSWRVKGTSTSVGTASTFAAASNNTYELTVTDKAGNVGVCEKKVSNIDSTPPTCSISGNPTSWTKDDPTLTITATDDSGIKSYQWKKGGSNISGATSSTYEISANATYSAVVTDNAGNAKTCDDVVVTKIDKVAPVLTISPSSAGTASKPWCKGKALKATCTDSGSGIPANGLVLTDNGYTNKNSSSGSKVTASDVLNSVRDGDITTTATCKDAAGNSADKITMKYYIRGKYTCKRSKSACSSGWTEADNDDQGDCYKTTINSCTPCTAYTGHSSNCKASSFCSYNGSSCQAKSGYSTYYGCHSCSSGFTWNSSRTSSSNACKKTTYKLYDACASGWYLYNGYCWQDDVSSCSYTAISNNCQ